MTVQGTLIELHPVTGRTHQLRGSEECAVTYVKVVCTHVFKTPIFGDAKYGGDAQNAQFMQVI